MAGGKKKKKPASNPARGFATTSIASKPKTGIFVPELSLSSNQLHDDQDSNLKSNPEILQSPPAQNELTAEEFERRLEESELQILVDKYALKSKKDAQRQKSRLETDQRILRTQAETLNTKKWLPPELMDEILEIIKFEGRFSDYWENPKQISPENLTIHLWTLHQVLSGSGFPAEKVSRALRHVLNVSDKLGTGTKDIVWGLEECMNWLSRECTLEELPDYESYNRKPLGFPKTSPESLHESEASTPYLQADNRHLNMKDAKGDVGAKLKSPSPVKKTVNVEYDSDLDPDDLLPIYLDYKTRLFNLTVSKSSKGHPSENHESPSSNSSNSFSDHHQSAQIIKKLKKIEDDILFDKYVADQKWKSKEIQLRKDAANKLRAVKADRDNSICSQISHEELKNSAEANEKAAIIDASILNEDSSDDDALLTGLFSDFPSNNTGPAGDSATTINSNRGLASTIRDFGEWTGTNPRKILEDLCRAKDISVKFNFKLVYQSVNLCQHSLSVIWSKAQEGFCHLPPEIKYVASPNSQCFTMTKVSTPNSRQSEAYIATAAIYFLFNSKLDKVHLRLPPSWRDLWTEFVNYEKELVDEIDRNSIRVFRDMVREKRDQELEDGVLIKESFGNRYSSRLADNKESLLDECSKSEPASETLQDIWHKKSSTPAYRKILESRKQLPMWSFKDKLLETVESAQVVIICGETGCGKSTQVPAFILEHQLSCGRSCKIYVTEPRRLAAISLAHRVSQELGEAKGDLGTQKSLTGYVIRLDSKMSENTRLVYATTGIVIRMLEVSNDLKDITHIVVDEVHERTIGSDFLLIVLRKILTQRSDLKIILMSATVDADRFSKYFDGAPILNVPGRVFPVQVKFIEDAVELTGYSLADGYRERFIDIDEDLDKPDSDLSDIVKKENLKALRDYSINTRITVAQIDPYRIDFDLITLLLSRIATDSHLDFFSKAILVFLPGIGEIRQLNDMLIGHPTFSSDWNIHILHSTIANKDQEAAFLIPPLGTRKIVLATNIAETGITIPDVTCVIDTGKHREMRFDEKRQLSRLLETFISRANAKQRRGRAGRVQEGLCFHMFTKYRHDNLMTAQQTPEFLRLSLQDLVIRVKICKLGGIEETLKQALDPPLPKNIRKAIDVLIDVRALTPAEDLTPLGIQLARLPLDVFLGKLVLLGCIFRCLDASLTIAAILSSKSPFSTPIERQAQADRSRLAYRRGNSDLLTVYNAYLAWKRVCLNQCASESQFCRDNLLVQQNLANIEELKGQLMMCLVDSGFLSLSANEKASLNWTRYSGRQHFYNLPQQVNINSENDLITASVIAWSFYPKLLVQDGKGYRNCVNNQTIRIHPSSVNKGHTEIKWLSYYHIMQAKQFFNAHETTAVEEFAIALLCGEARFDVSSTLITHDKIVTNWNQMYAGVVLLDGNRARFAASDWKTILVIKILRDRLREILSRSFKTPRKPLTEQQQKWIEIWQKVFLQKPIDEK